MLISFFFNYCLRTATIISVVHSAKCKEWTYFGNIFPHICTLIHTFIQIFPHYVSLENISVCIINFCWFRIEIFIRMYKMCDYLYNLFIYTHTLLLYREAIWYVLYTVSYKNVLFRCRHFYYLQVVTLIQFWRCVMFYKSCITWVPDNFCVWLINHLNKL